MLTPPLLYLVVLSPRIIHHIPKLTTVEVY